MKKNNVIPAIPVTQIVKTIYDRMENTIDNMKENFLPEKLTLRSLQKKLDNNSIDPEVIHSLAQDCMTLYQLKVLLDALCITGEFRKRKFEVMVWNWSEMVT
jgi:hypothetical protein